MNSIARALFIIGWICIGSGIILAFTNFQTIVGYEEPLTSFSDPEPIMEESFTVFISYIIAGFIVGIMMFGFAEIIKLLDIIASKHKDADDDKEKKKPAGEITKYDQFIEDSVNK